MDKRVGYINIRFSIRDLKPNEKGLYEINWLDNEIKLLSSNDDFIFTALTPEEAIIKSNIIYMLNKKHIKSFTIDFTNYHG